MARVQSRSLISRNVAFSKKNAENTSVDKNWSYSSRRWQNIKDSLFLLNILLMSNVAFKRAGKNSSTAKTFMFFKTIKNNASTLKICSKQQ